MTTCPSCGKLSYTEERAKEVETQSEGRVHAYHCWGGPWHLSSISPEGFNLKGKR